jgi:hypothetical protein
MSKAYYLEEFTDFHQDIVGPRLPPPSASFPPIPVKSSLVVENCTWTIFPAVLATASA